MVVVTMSAYLKGEGITLAATRPLIWAMSASRCALTSSHTWAGRETCLSLGKTQTGICAGRPSVLLSPQPHPQGRGVPGLQPLTNLSHAGIVNEAGVGTSTGYDEPRSEEPSGRRQLVVVDEAGLGLEKQITS